MLGVIKNAGYVLLSIATLMGGTFLAAMFAVVVFFLKAILTIGSVAFCIKGLCELESANPTGIKEKEKAQKNI